MNLDQLTTAITRDEGVRFEAYTDSEGNLTVGIGRNLDACPLTRYEMDAVGHDARSKPITRADAVLLLRNDITRALADLDRSIPWWKSLDEVRRLALANMCFNLGITRLLKFKETLGWLRQGHYAAAAGAMLDSKWSVQVGDRAKRLAEMVRTGRMPEMGP